MLSTVTWLSKTFQKKVKKQPFDVFAFVTAHYNFTVNLIAGHAATLVVDSPIIAYEE